MAARDLRIGDAERDAALTALGEHFAEGRLGREEYDDRAAAVWTARTRGDLEPMFADLPAPERARTGRQARSRSGGRWPFPLVPFFPVLVVLGVLTVITHLPFVLIPLLVWLVIGRRVWHHRARPRRATSW